jgi:SAM-dependent methyltransferase
MLACLPDRDACLSRPRGAAYNRSVSKVVIDIGSGDRKRPGALGVDIAPLPAVDVLADLSRGLPFSNSSVDAVHASHVLEHFDDLVGLMNEIWRICKPGGRVYITVPHATSSFMTWRDPTHQRGLNLSTFSYFDSSTADGRRFAYYSKTNFRRVYARLRFAARGSEGDEALRNPLARTITDALEAIANRSPYAQHLCERWWGAWLGIAEAYTVLEAVK